MKEKTDAMKTKTKKREEEEEGNPPPMKQEKAQRRRPGAAASSSSSFPPLPPPTAKITSWRERSASLRGALAAARSPPPAPVASVVERAPATQLLQKRRAAKPEWRN